MSKIAGKSPEFMANHFVTYLIDKYGGARHVRRVAPWIGLIVLGIEKISGQSWWVPKQRQLWFKHGGRSFKARYNHVVGEKGGIEIVEVLPGAGSPEGNVVFSITSLKGAEEFYNKAPKIFQKSAA
jgi:hypothetical protein